MKFCKDCAFYVEALSQRPKCYHESSVYTDTVTGKEVARYDCDTMRDACNFCGFGAAFFEEAE